MHVATLDIRGPPPAPSRSSRDASASDASTRAWRQEETDAGSDPGDFNPEFRSAIREDVGPGRLRKPWWYAVRFDSTRYRVIERLLGIIRLDYRLFTYLHQRPRRAPTVRSWLPGYFFAEFDAVCDEWRQLRHIPGVIQVLDDAPLSAVVIEDLVVRLPRRLEPAGECESIPRGSTVRLLTGTFSDRTAVVTWSERKRVRVLMMMFDRPMEVEFRTRDVEVVSA